MELQARNVNDAFNHATRALMLNEGEGQWHRQPSRNGDTLEFWEPVLTIYNRPNERVLFNAARDANPFLHFFEALWMLAGRDDLKFMVELVPRFADYSDDGRRLQGSYGYRWRKSFGIDQIEFLIRHLKDKPDSRRGVLQMWQPPSDLWGADFGTHVVGGINSRDIPCNLVAMFKIREGRLNMTVCCRSNDLLWGAYGANAVHFSILQEYIAAHLGVPVGTYIQMSDSLHLYTGGPGGKVWGRIQEWWGQGSLYRAVPDPYMEGRVTSMAMMDGSLDEWSIALRKFFELWGGGQEIQYSSFNHPWWSGVVCPMWNAYKHRSQEHAMAIEATDWKLAAQEWLTRHPKKEESK